MTARALQEALFRRGSWPALQKQFRLWQPDGRLPNVDKIVVNVGLGEALTNAESARRDRRRHYEDHRPEADRHEGQAVDSPSSGFGRATPSA